MAVILVCDEDAMVRNTIKVYATYNGHEIVEAEDGVKALSIIQNQPIDVVVTELSLNKLDGFSLIKEIRKKSKVPIIILSYLFEQSDKVLGFEENFPFDKETHRRFLYTMATRAKEKLVIIRK